MSGFHLLIAVTAEGQILYLSSYRPMGLCRGSWGVLRPHTHPMEILRNPQDYPDRPCIFHICFVVSFGPVFVPRELGNSVGWVRGSAV